MNLSVQDTAEPYAIRSSPYTEMPARQTAQFTQAAAADRPWIIPKTVDMLKEYGLSVATGVFQANMLVEINNDGPVTLLLDSEKLFEGS